MKELKNVLWFEEYRPKTLSDCILPESTRKEFEGFKKDNYCPNLILSGSTGTGKSSTAQALLNDIGADCLTINGSKDMGIDTLRTNIQQFASTVSLLSDNPRKYVLVEEADYMSHTVQPALRAFIEEFSGNCGFIFTCNYPGRIMKELKAGRCTEIQFKIPAKEAASIASQYFKRVCKILDDKNIPYEREAVAQYVKLTFPDLRKCINDIQRFSKRGKIDSGIFAASSDANWDELYKALKDKNFNSMRKWVGMNTEIEPPQLFRKLFEDLAPKLKQHTVPSLILTLGEYQFKSSLVVDQEINTTAMLTEIMTSIEFA